MKAMNAIERSGIGALGLVALLAAAVHAQDGAAKIDWSPCQKEIQQFECKGTDQEIWTCLEQHDKQLSSECQVPHAQGDKLFKKAK